MIIDGGLTSLFKFGKADSVGRLCRTYVLMLAQTRQKEIVDFKKDYLDFRFSEYNCETVKIYLTKIL